MRRKYWSFDIFEDQAPNPHTGELQPSFNSFFKVFTPLFGLYVLCVSVVDCFKRVLSPYRQREHSAASASTRLVSRKDAKSKDATKNGYQTSLLCFFDSLLPLRPCVKFLLRKQGSAFLFHERWPEKNLQ